MPTCCARVVESRPNFKPWLHHLFRWPRVIYLTSQSLSFIICRMEFIKFGLVSFVYKWQKSKSNYIDQKRELIGHIIKIQGQFGFRHCSVQRFKRCCWNSVSFHLWARLFSAQFVLILSLLSGHLQIYVPTIESPEEFCSSWSRQLSNWLSLGYDCG